MLSILQSPFVRFWPEAEFFRSLRRSARPTINVLDIDAMPESLKRDIGLTEGRVPRGGGATGEGAFSALRTMSHLRPL